MILKRSFGKKCGYIFLRRSVNVTASKVQRGDGIDEEASVSLSSDEQVVTIGAPANVDCSGHVRIHERKDTSSIQRRGDIDGKAESDISGASVFLYADGDGVAMGAQSNGDNGGLSGHVRIYEMNDTTWAQKGAVSLPGDGLVVAIGAIANDASLSRLHH